MVPKHSDSRALSHGGQYPDCEGHSHAQQQPKRGPFPHLRQNFKVHIYHVLNICALIMLKEDTNNPQAHVGSYSIHRFGFWGVILFNTKLLVKKVVV